VVANRPFARLLGYDSPAELQRIASTFGIFGGPAELDRLRCTLQSGSPSTLLFRRKDGQREALEVVGAGSAEAGLNAVAGRRDDSAAPPGVPTRSAGPLRQRYLERISHQERGWLCPQCAGGARSWASRASPAAALPRRPPRRREPSPRPSRSSRPLTRPPF